MCSQKSTICYTRTDVRLHNHRDCKFFFQLGYKEQYVYKQTKD